MNIDFCLCFQKWKEAGYKNLWEPEENEKLKQLYNSHVNDRIRWNEISAEFKNKTII